MSDGLDSLFKTTGALEKSKIGKFDKHAVNSMAEMTLKRQAKGLGHEAHFEEEHYDDGLPPFRSLWEMDAQDAMHFAVAQGHLGLFVAHTMASIA